jgi:hypothetical protein
VPETASLFKLVESVLDKERQPDQNNILTFIHDLFTIQKKPFKINASMMIQPAK